MSSATRRAHTRAIRRRHEPRPRNLLTIRVRGDASRARAQVARATQLLAEFSERHRRLGVSAHRSMLSARELYRQMRGIKSPAGDLHLMVVTTTNGSRLVAQRLGGWQRMRPTPSERNP